MAVIYDDKFWNKKKTLDERIGDSMLAIAIGTAVLFWLFSVLIRFLDSPDLGLGLLLMGTELQFYEQLLGSTLFIVFGSHVSSAIKKRRQAEENVKKIKKKYRDILAGIKDGYFETNIRGEVKFINNAMSTFLARDEIDIIGSSMVSHLDKKYIPGFSTLFNQIKNNQERTGEIKCKFKLKTGEIKNVEISVSQITNNDMKITGVSGLVRNIS